MNVGQLDRRVTVQEVSYTVDTFGQRLETWVKRKDAFAGKRDEFAMERTEAGQVVEVVRTTWTFRYRDAVKATERILYEGELYYVLGIMELGRKEGLRVLTEKRNSPR